MAPPLCWPAKPGLRVQSLPANYRYRCYGCCGELAAVVIVQRGARGVVQFAGWFDAMIVLKGGEQMTQLTGARFVVLSQNVVVAITQVDQSL